MNRQRGPLKLHVLCWSHLDREWDFPFESTRVEFADIIEGIMELLEKNPDCAAYHLDGQVVPLEDHLTLKPENRARVERLTRAGRLLIGPWYALPEMNVIAGESIARNFLWGRKAAEPFGGVMKVGLSNTGWGQISQMPQILKNFGIDTYTSYRGVPVNDIERECLWEGSDGSRVMLIRPSPGPRSMFFTKIMMPAHRYYRWRESARGSTPEPAPGVHLAQTDAAILEPYFAEFDADRFELEHVIRRVPEILRLLEPDATTRHLWVGYWQDSMHPHPRLMEAVAEARRHLPDGGEIVIGRLPDYVEALRRERMGLKVQVRGEMRTPRKGGDAAELMNVLSSRPGLKVAHREAELELIHGAEFWAAAAAAMGMAYPRAALDRAWRFLLLNTCHDTIGGVGVDRIHEDQMNRYARLGDLAATVKRQALSHLVRRVGLAPREVGESGLTLFNSLPFDRSGTVECSLDVPLPSDAMGIRVKDAAGRDVPVEILSSRDLDTKVYESYDRYAMQALRRFRVRLRSGPVPGCGWAAYSVHPSGVPRAGRPMRGGPNWMANEYLRVRFLPDGTYELRARGIGRAFAPCGWYEDTGNVSNGWGYRAPEQDERVDSRGTAARVVRLAHSALRTTFCVESVFRVPEAANAARDGRTRRRVGIPIRSELTLLTGDPCLHVRTTLFNAAKDHRLRVMVPSVPGATHSWAETPFDVVRRAIEIPDSTGWEEPWQGTQPMLSFVDVSDGKTGLAVIPRGLCEYEVLDDPDRTLAVTLLRAYAYRHPYARNILAAEVRGSQCPGEQTFEYSLCPHAGDWERGHVQAVSGGALIPLVPVQHFGGTSPGPHRASLIRLGSGKLVLHALKRTEQGDGLIVRLGNPTGSRVVSDVTCLVDLKEAVLCTMAEEPLKRLPIRGRHTVRIEAGPRKVISLRLETAARRGAGASTE